MNFIAKIILKNEKTTTFNCLLTEVIPNIDLKIKVNRVQYGKQEVLSTGKNIASFIWSIDIDLDNNDFHLAVSTELEGKQVDISRFISIPDKMVTFKVVAYRKVTVQEVQEG